MLKQVKKISALLLICSFASCINTDHKPAKNNTANYDWLVGPWKNDTDTSSLFFENWTKDLNGNYAGVSYILAHNDTVFFESVQLMNTDSGTFYSVTVNDQNNKEAIHFKLISNVKHTLIFENKYHDFPQKIIYQYQAPDTLNAWIEGMVDKKHRKEMFKMWRVR